MPSKSRPRPTESEPETVKGGPAVSGVRLGSWELVREIGSGGMGKVYLARHARLGREVAIKLLRSEFAEDQESVARFFNEARTVNAINHEHIVEIFDFVEEEGDPPRVYCVLERLDGQSLAKAERAGPLALARILDIARQVAEALGAAHAAGIIHRDVKPSNVILIRRGGRDDFVKVLDFGIAKVTRPLEGGADLSTRTGLALGTPQYMAPEQAMGKTVDPRADIYSWGLMLYEMLCGHRPFDAESVTQLLVQLVTEPPKALPGRTATDEAIPPRLADLVMRCLKKKPEERPASMGEVLDTLDRLWPSGTTAVLPVRPPRPARSRRGWWIGAGALVLVVAGLGLWRMASHPAVHPSTAPTPVPVEAARAPVAAPPLQSPKPIPKVKPKSKPTEPTTPTPSKAAAVVLPAKAESKTNETGVTKAPNSQKQKTITLSVRSTPPGAKVLRMDTGEVVGVTPLKVNVAPVGEVTLRLVKNGFIVSNRRVALTENIRLDVPLRRAARVRHRKRRVKKEKRPVDRDAPLNPFASP